MTRVGQDSYYKLGEEDQHNILRLEDKKEPQAVELVEGAVDSALGGNNKAEEAAVP